MTRANKIPLWRRIRRNFRKKDDKPKFIDLAPTGVADNASVYFEALNYATTNDAVLNIALTGPYGSGKSSVIKSFLKVYKKPALQLSLASFLPEGEVRGIRPKKQEIERSLLQQILYGVEARRLPFSRFKRIQTPRWFSPAVSLFIAVSLVCAWYLVNKQGDILSGAFFWPTDLSNWLNLLTAVVVGVFAWRVVHSIYTTSFGLSLKSISLKDVQIAPANASEESILNRHLDEILYFFQSTKYDLVVIEDLDRFDNPDIFVTLREINGLINANEGMKRRVRFLYALRDDIFANTDRTKFFEFIVPIIPVINHSNSIDKVLEQIQRLALDDRLNRQFLRDVSRYLSDLRLIQNIFNEYVVYAANIKADADAPLDPNKLLAVLIYKNVIPQDFAALHRQEGALSRVLGRYEDYVAAIEQRIRGEIAAIEADLAVGEAQLLRDRVELRRVYAMAIIERVPAGFQTVQTSDMNVSLGELTQSPALEEIVTRKSVMMQSPTHGRRSFDLGDIQGAVDPDRTFEQRKEDIARKSSKAKLKSLARIRELKLQLSSLRTRRFNEVVRESADLIGKIFSEVGDSKELLKFLILEGYLDDTYYQYISLFHSGRLSPNDNNFLIQIRAYGSPAPDFQLDNTAEVVASMRPGDFGHKYVLNRFVVDYLFSNVVENSGKIEAAVGFISAHFDECVDFFRSYYSRGSHVETVVATLAAQWPSFAAVALETADGASHAARILAYAPQRSIDNSSSLPRPLTEFLSVNMQPVLAEGVEFALDRLVALQIQVDDLASLSDFPDALAVIATEGLYRVSIANIAYILGEVVSWQRVGDLETRHFSVVREANDANLLRRIREDFPTYVKDVLLRLPANTQETASAICEVLGNDDVEHELRDEFLSKQTTILPRFEGIPVEFHQAVMERAQVEPTWENCSGFMASDSYDAELLSKFLQSSRVFPTLSKRPMPNADINAGLRQFVVENDALPLDVYRAYVRQLPRVRSGFPEVGATKRQVLISERKVAFKQGNLDDLENAGLKALFIAYNIAEFEAKQADFSVDDTIRASLLRTEIADVHKLKIIEAMDEAYIAASPQVAADVGPILDRSPSLAKSFTPDLITSVVLSSRPMRVQISLFNKLHSSLPDDRVREILASMPAPFREIGVGGKSPKLENTDVNGAFAAWLADTGIISSYSEISGGDEIRLYSFRRS